MFEEENEEVAKGPLEIKDCSREKGNKKFSRNVASLHVPRVYGTWKKKLLVKVYIPNFNNFPYVVSASVFLIRIGCDYFLHFTLQYFPCKLIFKPTGFPVYAFV